MSTVHVTAGAIAAGASVIVVTSHTCAGTTVIVVTSHTCAGAVVIVVTSHTCAGASVIVVTSHTCAGTTVTSSTKTISSAAGTMSSAAGTVIVSGSSTSVISARSSTMFNQSSVSAVSVIHVSRCRMSHQRMVHATQSSVPRGSAANVVSVAIVVASVSTSVIPVDGGMTVEVIAACIVVVDGEVPSTAEPSQWAEQIAGGNKCCPLPIVQDVAQVFVSIGQITCVCQIGFRVHRQQVVEVDFVGIVILLVVQVQLVRHFVRQVVSLLACRFVIHSHCSRPGCQCHHQGHHVTFHSRMF